MTIHRFVATIALLLGVHAAAAESQVWEVAGVAELLRGQLDGTVVTARGTVRKGYGFTPVVGQTGVIFALDRGPDGALFAATGLDGEVWRIHQGTAQVAARTDQVAVVAMAFDPSGDLYLATLPDPIIWRVSKDQLQAAAPKDDGRPFGAVQVATIPGEDTHVLDLVYAPGAGLLAATGPQGKIFAVSPTGKVTVYADLPQNHVVDLAVTKDGTVYAGTAPSALLVRIDGPGRYFAVADFYAQEATAIAPLPDGRLAVALNEYSWKKPNTLFKDKKTGKGQEGDSNRSGNNETSSLNLPKGRGAVFLVDPATGTGTHAWSRDDAYVAAVAADSRGHVWIGLGVGGGLIEVDQHGRWWVEAGDLDARQILSLYADDTLRWLGTGDPGSVFAVTDAPAEASYTSAVLDTQFTSRWGVFRWYGTPKVRAFGRCGNTKEPDVTWTQWESVRNGAIMPCPATRYLQVRFDFAQADREEVDSFELSFHPRNYPVIVSSWSIQTRLRNSNSRDSGKVARSTRTRPTAATAPKKEISVEWDVANYDDDTIRYRLYYKLESQSDDYWIPVFSEDEVYTATGYDWDVSQLPAGRYVLKLVADDSPSNATDVSQDVFLFPPVVVDTQPPVLTKVAFRNGRVTGTATDAFSPIGAFRYRVDDGPSLPAPCKDGVFDEPTESFDFALPDTIPPGPHMLVITATDREGNATTARLGIRIAP